MYKFTFIFVSLLSALMGKKSMDHISVGMYRNLNKSVNGKAEFTLWNLRTQEHFHEDIPVIMQVQTAHTNYKF
jgi:hypothetical protein